MNKTKATKKALLMSMLSMLICIAMLVGSTFAWFTDSVTSGMNKITAGNLDVELEYAAAGTTVAADGTIADGDWHTVDAATPSLFKDALWEPGHTEYVYLRVRNAGSLALEYGLSAAVYGSEDGKTPEATYTNMKGNQVKLSQFLVFNVIEGTKEVTDRDSLWISDADAEKAAMGKLNSLKTDGKVLYPAKSGAGDSEKTFTLAVYMPTTVDNDANWIGAKIATDETAPEIYLGLNLKATQTPYEEDSFNDQYDADAAADFYVASQEDFNDALTEAKSGDTVELSSGTFTLPESVPADVAIVGNGPEETVIDLDKPYSFNPGEDKSINFSNLKIDGSDVHKHDGTKLLNITSGSAVFDNVEIYGGGTDTWGASIQVTSKATELVVRNSKISGGFRAIIAESCSANVIVENCDIDATYPVNFDGCSGTLTVKDSKLHGWTSYGGACKGATFENVTFSKGTSNSNNNVRGYANTTFSNCTFDTDFWYGAANNPVEINVNGCKKADGTSITAENVIDILEKTDNANTTVYVDGSEVEVTFE